MNFLNVCKKVLLVQPSSEAVFSLLENSFNTLEDYIETSLMLQYYNTPIFLEHNNLSWSTIGTFLEHNW